jgi:hypothetical protein
MWSSLIDTISVAGTSTIATTTGERIFDFSVKIPFFNFLVVVIIFGAAFFSFIFFFKTIWAE